MCTSLSEKKGAIYGCVPVKCSIGVAYNPSCRKSIYAIKSMTNLKPNPCCTKGLWNLLCLCLKIRGSPYPFKAEVTIKLEHAITTQWSLEDSFFPSIRHPNNTQIFLYKMDLSPNVASDMVYTNGLSQIVMINLPRLNLTREAL